MECPSFSFNLFFILHLLSTVGTHINLQINAHSRMKKKKRENEGFSVTIPVILIMWALMFSFYFLSMGPHYDQDYDRNH